MLVCGSMDRWAWTQCARAVTTIQIITVLTNTSVIMVAGLRRKSLAQRNRQTPMDATITSSTS
jgi:hypothetical protein